jgi:predicted DNA-binding transcriptional regulator AlpA
MPANSERIKRARAKLEAKGVEVEWTAEEVAAYLGMSPSSVYTLCRKRLIPHRQLRPPGWERPHLRFRKAEIDTWREKHSEVVAV